MSESPEERSRRIQHMFDEISPRYDLLNTVLSFGRDRSWRRRAVDALKPEAGDALLDIACGTGDVALTAWRRHRRIGSITGVDFSARMLDLARTKFTRRDVDVPWEFIQADARRLPLAHESVDLVTIAFGIRNVVDVPAALREMHRVLRPGGRVMILEFATPEGRFFGPLFRWYFHHVLPRVGGLVSGRRSAYTYLPKSVGKFHTVEELKQLLRDAGFVSVEATRYTFGVTVAYLGVKGGDDE
jgi:demethylmenaquinone methyltransferase / 2-methoxy-6-polyprenyl-1,4-benzoquinol methylase